jgi:hypothetical protein
VIHSLHFIILVKNISKAGIRRNKQGLTRSLCKQNAARISNLVEISRYPSFVDWLFESTKDLLKELP